MQKPIPFRIRDLALPHYLPAALEAIATGMILPIIPLFSRALGSSIGVAGAMVGMLPLGSMLANVPAGFLVEHFGRRRALLTATAMEVLFVALAALTRSVVILAFCIAGAGMMHAVVHIARLSLFRENVPTSHRGRAISLLGGDFRLGGSVGPVIGGFVARSAGLHTAFFASSLSLMLSGAAIWIWTTGRHAGAGSSVPPDAEGSEGGTEGAALPPLGPPGVTVNSILTNGKAAIGHGARRSLALLREHWKTFATACLAIVLLSLTRVGRQSLFPLWGEAIGIDVAQIGLIFGILNGIELMLFYPAGIVMDRFGRKATAVPCMAILGGSLFFLPQVGTFLAFAVVAGFSGVGNGIGAGINMTLSTDFAPTERSGEFIGIWRMLSDFGSLIGPATVGAAAQLFGLAAAAPIVGSAGLAGALIMLFLVPEPSKRTRQA